MTTEIHKNYMIVSSIDSMGQLMSCSIPEEKDIAAVFAVKRGAAA